MIDNNSSVNIARKIVMSFIRGGNMSFEEQVLELAAVGNNDEYLLEHIEIMLEILEKARKELKKKDDRKS